MTPRSLTSFCLNVKPLVFTLGFGGNGVEVGLDIGIAGNRIEERLADRRNRSPFRTCGREARIFSPRATSALRSLASMTKPVALGAHLFRLLRWRTARGKCARPTSAISSTRERDAGPFFPGVPLRFHAVVYHTVRLKTIRSGPPPGHRAHLVHLNSGKHLRFLDRLQELDFALGRWRRPLPGPLRRGH